MINANISKIILERLDENSLVIDIGGGRSPWFRANYVLDIRSIDEKVGVTAFGEEDQALEYFSPDTWIQRDFYDLPWPFEDNQFDFMVCMGTLEDLRDPMRIAQEIQRISKAGYISMPTRAAESCFAITKKPLTSRLHGYQHHRWFVEIVDGALTFKVKHPLLYQSRQWRVRTFGQHTLNFFWQDSFDCREVYLGSTENAVDEMKKFCLEHEEWLRLPDRTSEQAMSRYNHWPRSWGPWPEFWNCDNKRQRSRSKMARKHSIGFIKSYLPRSIR